jgi:LmbE family N-acetylglucosaminyl deacetylase
MSALQDATLRDHGGGDMLDRSASRQSNTAKAVMEEQVGSALRRLCSSGTEEFELIWPEVTCAEWDTAFLAVRIKAENDGSPYLSIVSDNTCQLQYFPAADEGLRWLNLSGLGGKIRPGMRAHIRGHAMTVEEGPVTLRLFSNNLDLSKPILVLAPHPDDAEIAAFGLYARRHATIVTITAGNAGTPIYEPMFCNTAEHYAFKGHIRVVDSVTIPWQGGIPPHRCFNLGYFDARLEDMYVEPNRPVQEQHSENTDIGVYRRDNLSSLLGKRCRASTWVNLVTDLTSLLEKIKPSIIVTPHPQLDLHTDHQFTTVALTQALDRGQTPVRLLLYTIHAVDGRYPYGPAGTLISLPPTESETVIRGVYSHPVSESVQRAKLFALESMHDVRHQYRSYLRTGPGANELFYVCDERTIKPVIDSFLKARLQQRHLRLS